MCCWGIGEWYTKTTPAVNMTRFAIEAYFEFLIVSLVGINLWFIESHSTADTVAIYFNTILLIFLFTFMIYVIWFVGFKSGILVRKEKKALLYKHSHWLEEIYATIFQVDANIDKDSLNINISVGKRKQMAFGQAKKFLSASGDNVMFKTMNGGSGILDAMTPAAI